ncbi:MAG: hypothetical protein HY319_12495 [Armatimonadetes bacterium]|nr:hypothetical protein [Armatimonadota bacterium]
MSQEEVLAYLQANIGPDGTQWPARGRDRHNQLLAEEIKRRGVNFHYQAVGKFSDEIHRNRAYSPVINPLEENFGPPATANYFFGTWEMWKVGAPTMRRAAGSTSAWNTAAWRAP